VNKLRVDLPTGKKGEELVLAHIHQKYPEAYAVEGKFLFYDIFVPEIDIRVECKFDKMSKKTGNVAIEYECYGKPSGISASKAEWWAIIYFNKEKDDYEIGFVSSEKLKEVCPSLRKVKGGDDWASKMYLLPVAQLIRLLEKPV
jgi:hypothetical protein